MKHKNIILFIIFSLYSINSAFVAENTKKLDKKHQLLAELKAEQSKKKNYFPFEKEAMKNPNICPVCGKSWDMVDGKNIHVNCLKKLLPPKIEIRCGSCGQYLSTRIKNITYKAELMDKDFCPHPHGPNRPVSNLVICPKCGYSDTIANHKKRLSMKQRAWVLNTLAPVTQREILRLLHLDIKKLNITEHNAYKIFIDPTVTGSQQKSGRELIIESEVPEFIRTVNALKFAEKFYPTNFPILARDSWYAAWAYRKIVVQPMTNSELMDSVNRIMDILEKKFPIPPDPEARVNELVVLYKDSTLYPLIDRQVMLILMSGDYLRLGFRSWAKDCLSSVVNTVKNDSAWAKLKAKIGDKKVKMQRAILRKNAKERMFAIDKEGVYLKKSAEYLRKALIVHIKTKKVFKIDEIPANVYLIGEFEKRLEHYGRAYFWLKAASKMQLPNKKSGAEIWAMGELDSIRSAVGNNPINPSSKTDNAILSTLAKMVHLSNQ